MNKKVLYLVTEDWYFLSHRLPLALECKKEGYEVYVACKDTGKIDDIKKYNFNCININLHRGSSSIFVIFKNILEVRKIIKSINASIIHAVSMQSIILGLLATFFNRKVKFVAAVTGLGTLFLVNNFKGKIIKFLLSIFLIISFKKRNIRIIVQNIDDKRYVSKSLFCAAHKIYLIRGSGVNINFYKFQEEPAYPPIVICYVGRLIKDKGIENLIEAFNMAHTKNKDIKLLLVGGLDKNNIRPISSKYIKNIKDNNNIEYVGEVEDIRKIWGRAHIAILLSRREGLPKSLLEAAASGRAIISSDVPGSREIAMQSINAELVKYNDISAMVKAILYLAEEHDVRRSYGYKSRELVKSDMSENEIIKRTLLLYKDLYKNIS